MAKDELPPPVNPWSASLADDSGELAALKAELADHQGILIFTHALLETLRVGDDAHQNAILHAALRESGFALPAEPDESLPDNLASLHGYAVAALGRLVRIAGGESVVDAASAETVGAMPAVTALEFSHPLPPDLQDVADSGVQSGRLAPQVAEAYAAASSNLPFVPAPAKL